MKTLVVGLLLIGFTTLSFAQNELAYADTSTRTTIKKVKSNNAAFINSVSFKDMSKRILYFQKEVADYDVTKASVYSDKASTTYTVVFKEANNTIEAIYNKDGDVIESHQEFSAIKLPYAMSSKLVKAHPGWAIHDVDCTIKYETNKTTSISYRVKLKKESQTKTVKITQ